MNKMERPQQDPHRAALEALSREKRAELLRCLGLAEGLTGQAEEGNLGELVIKLRDAITGLQKVEKVLGAEGLPTWMKVKDMVAALQQSLE